MQIMLLRATLKLTQHLFLYGFLTCLKYCYILIIFLIFVNVFNFVLNFAMEHHRGHSLPVCASNGDAGGHK